MLYRRMLRDKVRMVAMDRDKSEDLSKGQYNYTKKFLYNEGETD